MWLTVHVIALSVGADRDAKREVLLESHLGSCQPLGWGNIGAQLLRFHASLAGQ